MFDVREFGLVWVGLGQLFGGLGWAGSTKIDPRTTLDSIEVVFKRYVIQANLNPVVTVSYPPAVLA